jgi:bis(5'-nucleosyl)-tetraphosphatase (symmetrical)
LPEWTVDQATALGAEVHLALQAPNYREFLQHMYGNDPKRWDDGLNGWDRLRVITNAMTRLRICSADGEMEFKFKGELQNIPDGYQPWFELSHRASVNTPIVFGHWSALGLQHKNNVYSLDTGCLWGGHLSAMRLEDRQIFQVPCHPDDSPLKLDFTD